MAKRPSFQFYPSDWLRDTALRSCSIAARGLWMDMICFMHEGTPYGYLKVNHKVILSANLAAMVGVTPEVSTELIDELADAGVVQVDADGVMFSRRMVRDEELRLVRSAGGKLGGNPNLLTAVRLTTQITSEVNQKVKQKTTPSSSSSLKTTTSSLRFDEFWSAYPNCKRKGSKQKCLAKWKGQKLDAHADQIISHVRAMATSDDWTKQDGQFIPATLSYITQARWDGAELGNSGSDENQVYF